MTRVPWTAAVFVRCSDPAATAAVISAAARAASVAARPGSPSSPAVRTAGVAARPAPTEASRVAVRTARRAESIRCTRLIVAPRTTVRMDGTTGGARRPGERPGTSRDRLPLLAARRHGHRLQVGGHDDVAVEEARGLVAEPARVVVALREVAEHEPAHPARGGDGPGLGRRQVTVVAGHLRVLGGGGRLDDEQGGPPRAGVHGGAEPGGPDGGGSPAPPP